MIADQIHTKKEVMTDKFTGVLRVCYLPGDNSNVIDNLSGIQKSIWYCATKQINLKRWQVWFWELTKQTQIDSKTHIRKKQASCWVQRRELELLGTLQLTSLDYFLDLWPWKGYVHNYYIYWWHTISKATKTEEKDQTMSEWRG